MRSVPTGDEREIFTGTASYYAKYRPWYPERMFEHLREYFGLDGTGSLLDIGCGTGQVVLPLAKDFKEAIGLDIEPQMIEEAKKEAEKRNVSNVRFILGKGEDIDASTGTFKLITLGASLHWMDGPRVLKQAYSILEKRGGISLIQNPTSGWTNNKEEWKQVRKSIIQKYLGDERKNGGFLQTWRDWEDLLEESPFGAYEEWTYDYEIRWTLEQAIGYLYSTSFAQRHMFGDRLEEFEKELGDALLSVEPSGIFSEKVGLQVLTAEKQSS